MERCLVAAVDQATARQRRAGAMTAKRAASMQPVDDVVVLLGRGVPAASIRQWCGLALVTYLVIRCGLVSKVGTVRLKTYI